MRNSLLFLVVGVITLALAEKVRYDNYQVHRLIPKNEAQLQALHELMLSGKFDFWLEPRKVGLPVDVLVPPTKKQFFQFFLRTNGIQHEIKIENAQKLIDEEQKRMATRSTKQVEWTDYHTLDEINDWLDQLEDQNENVRVVVGGKTYEGRDIRGIEINNGDGLPGVVIESGIHAREWITVAASSWVVNQIVNADSDSIWRQFNWLYFPSVNPDGYVFSWENDRYWRKTRTPYRLGIITCYGADANRNYGSHWGEGGSDLNNPCSEVYAGPSAFSELESQSLSDYLTQIATERNNQIYVAYHSYSQLLMFPWGYTGTPIPEHDLYQSIGDAAAESLRQVHGTRFEVGSIYDTIYQTSGTSTEWYYDKLNPVLSYVYEMRDTGNYGFVLPPDQIIPAGEEHLASLQTILEEFQKLGKK